MEKIVKIFVMKNDCKIIENVQIYKDALKNKLMALHATT